MLLQYSVKNFLSFKDEVTLSMLATKRKSQDRTLDEGAVLSVMSDLDVLKCAVIYGANNSGKTNLVKSLKFLKRLVLDSSKESRAKTEIEVTPFLLSPDTETGASSFEVIFIQGSYLFQYGVSVTRERIQKECLSRRALKKGGVTVELFDRDVDSIKVGKAFKEGRGLEARTRSNALFLSVCANFDGPLSTEVTEWFTRLKIISGVNDVMPLAWTAGRLDSPEYGEDIKNLLKAFDLGIDRFEAGEEIPGIKFQGVEVSVENAEASEPAAQAQAAVLESLLKGVQSVPSRKIISIHKMYDAEGEFVREVSFDLKMHESEGTKKLVALAGPLVDTLKSAHIVFIDEFESRLHANVTKAILRMFNTSKGNPNGAQLIAVTHDTNLLNGDILRRDQIWFAGRDGLGRSSLRSLVEFKVRNDASFEKNYLEGAYGGVPYLREELSAAPKRARKNRLKQREI
ncbi:ATP-binding protein [Hydrogenophaga sp.]|uniref:AAA family ATPase n=1 Tax=Hydrogenophaga sp. TaxID=1904254 RepID=UPI0025BE026D|nr:ATP-binding protein [Hydrogenophaga sp.]MBT9463163.1 ATP-binding protein [Hydrogenophaga sp.]